MTEKLYYEDPSLFAFEAEVMDLATAGNSVGVILNRTAFYPEGGGQPGDRGTIGKVKVHDTTLSPAGEIIHWVEAGSQVPDIGTSIVGKVDEIRRRDHCQQHSAQHLLSQAFARLFNWETLSFHLGSETSTIDLDVAEAEWEELLRAENLTNSVVFNNEPCQTTVYHRKEDLPISLRLAGNADDGLPVATTLRVVSFGDYDATLCGGTHVSASGEIGLVKILGTEKSRGSLRLHFAAGERAASQFERYRSVLSELCKLHTTGRADIIDAADRTLVDNRRMHREIRRLRSELGALHADHLKHEAIALPGGVRLVVASVEGDASYLQHLVSKVGDDAIVLLAGTEGGNAHFVFCCPQELDLDCAGLLRTCLDPYGGGGGGSSCRAQGGGISAEKAPDVLRRAEEEVMKGLR